MPISTLPKAARSATAEPLMPAKKTLETTVVMPSPPGKWPTIARARLTSRWMIPPCAMNSPARKKNGMASSRNWSVPAPSCCATTMNGMVPFQSR